ncbi:MAG: hypothetical protein J3K34DRAFT_399944 [Monoraphidium minutum]|nr:MAG: hypothetical protein J3K34DRAFT_399944 [Monoraphidium minutum]
MGLGRGCDAAAMTLVTLAVLLQLLAGAAAGASSDGGHAAGDALPNSLTGACVPDATRAPAPSSRQRAPPARSQWCLNWAGKLVRCQLQAARCRRAQRPRRAAAGSGQSDPVPNLLNSRAPHHPSPWPQAGASCYWVAPPNRSTTCRLPRAWQRRAATTASCCLPRQRRAPPLQARRAAPQPRPRPQSQGRRGGQAGAAARWSQRRRRRRKTAPRHGRSSARRPRPRPR